MIDCGCILKVLHYTAVTCALAVGSGLVHTLALHCQANKWNTITFSIASSDQI